MKNNDILAKSDLLKLGRVFRKIDRNINNDLFKEMLKLAPNNLTEDQKVVNAWRIIDAVAACEEYFCAENEEDYLNFVKELFSELSEEDRFNALRELSASLEKTNDPESVKTILEHKKINIELSEESYSEEKLMVVEKKIATQFAGIGITEKDSAYFIEHKDEFIKDYTMYNIDTFKKRCIIAQQVFYKSSESKHPCLPEEAAIAVSAHGEASKILTSLRRGLITSDDAYNKLKTVGATMASLGILLTLICGGVSILLSFIGLEAALIGWTALGGLCLLAIGGLTTLIAPAVETVTRNTELIFPKTDCDWTVFENIKFNAVKVYDKAAETVRSIKDYLHNGKK